MAFRGVIERPESNSERFLKEFSNTAKTLHGIKQGEITSELGIDKENLDRDKLKFAREKLDLDRQRLGQESAKDIEKRRGYEIGLGTIKSMRPIVEKLGVDPATFISGFLPGTETSAAIQKYTTYANSLLGILSTIPVRNQKEFESVQKALSSPHSSQSNMTAALDAAEDIISRHYESLGGSIGSEKKSQNQFSGESQKPSRSTGEKIKFNPSNNPEHLAKLKQLEKFYKDQGHSPEEVKKMVNRDLAREFK